MSPAAFADTETGAVDQGRTESGFCMTCESQSTSPLTPAARFQAELMSSISIRALYSQYSESEKVTNLIKIARIHIKLNPKKYIKKVNGTLKTFCYRAVKEALAKSGMISALFGGSVKASDGVMELNNYGFRNLLDDKSIKSMLTDNPKMAPKGSILVYETAPGARVSIYGHIEIKTEHSGVDGYISISETSSPTYGYLIPQQRKLIGVLVKT